MDGAMELQACFERAGGPHARNSVRDIAIAALASSTDSSAFTQFECWRVRCELKLSRSSYARSLQCTLTRGRRLVLETLGRSQPGFIVPHSGNRVQEPANQRFAR